MASKAWRVMTSGPNIPDKQRRNKRTNLSLSPAARAVVAAHPGEASRFASAGLVLLGAMPEEERERLIAMVEGETR